MDNEFHNQNYSLECKLFKCQLFSCSLNFMQEYLVPQEYVQTMRESMLNKCPVSSYDQVCEVFKKELGETPEKVCNSYFNCL